VNQPIFLGWSRAKQASVFFVLLYSIEEIYAEPNLRVGRAPPTPFHPASSTTAFEASARLYKSGHEFFLAVSIQISI
jgi:hypothetical protein